MKKNLKENNFLKFRTIADSNVELFCTEMIGMGGREVFDLDPEEFYEFWEGNYGDNLKSLKRFDWRKAHEQAHEEAAKWYVRMYK